MIHPWSAPLTKGREKSSAEKDERWARKRNRGGDNEDSSGRFHVNSIVSETQKRPAVSIP